MEDKDSVGSLRPKQAPVFNSIDEYESSLEGVDKKICQLILERKKLPSIISSFADFSEQVIRDKVSSIKSSLRSYIEENAYV